MPRIKRSLGIGRRDPTDDTHAAAEAFGLKDRGSFFVAAGEADFGLPMARVLDGALRRAGVTTRLRVFDDCEHMLVVGESLPSVVEFFDGLNDRESER